MTSVLRILLSGCLVVLCFACTVPTQSTKVVTPPVVQVPSTAGSLSIQIPATADWLQPFVKGSVSASGARAMLYATSVKVSVTDVNGYAVITPVTQTLTVDTASGNSPATLSPISVPAGTGYTIAVSVYNTLYSTYSPSVAGSLSGVTIVKGQTTTKSISCTPGYPITLVPNVLKSSSLTGHDEEWYTFTSLASQQYTLASGNSNVPAFLFSSDGTYIATITTTAPYVWTTTAETKYYVGVANTTTGSVSGSLLLSSVLPPANEGSVATPVPVSADSVDRTYLLGPNLATDQSSYYKFTTAEAGDYFFSSASGKVSWFVGTDATFVTTVSSGGFGASSFWIPNLAASTTYYLKLTNEALTVASFSGRLMSPSGLALVTNSEGSPTVPAPLTLGTAHAGQVGDLGYNVQSYYAFTTGTGRFYSAAVSSVAGSSSGIDYYVSTSLGSYYSSNAGSSSGGAKLFILTPNTTYYLVAYVTGYPSSPSLSDKTTYSVLMKTESAPTGTALTLDTATVGSLPAGNAVQYYNVTVPAAGNYVVSWEDRYSEAGTSNYTADIVVTAYPDDYSTTLFSLDAGYTSSQSLRTLVATGAQTFHFAVRQNYTNGTGSYSLRVNSPNEGSLVVSVR